ncbi:TOG array regulator of axonemal microtubules protein 1 [Cynara cardunculus var. scolymus]|uniref:Armadillo-like helical n=1 Tax=Cynara cardunculus var. scolymus TaxID=59895 RepID=A0A118JUD8_CYNCS|nr:TOG array regulator of axonemal microtubules protein 1 [Cynara cardunculus var. scolymus]KVH91587.1 Armadillo-like helical [Cynara cardunculus var. scolymus]
MALRPLDNTLPLSPERPKKNLKVSNSIAKPKQLADPTANDENIAPLASVTPVVDSIDYISSEDLKPISDADVKFQSLIEGLESKDWLKICDSLNDVRRMALYHSTLLLPILEKVLLILVKAMKNPRSALIKTSIMASSDLFKSYGDKLLESTTSDAVNHMILQLLLKASQDKKFVCEEAERSLNTMVVSTTPIPLLQKLKGYVNHGNMRVRAKAAVSISRCVSKMEMEELRDYGLVSLVQMSAELLKDRLPEAREAARSIVLLIYSAVMEEEDESKEEEKQQEKWQKFCQSNLSAIDALAMAKLVASQ